MKTFNVNVWRGHIVHFWIDFSVQRLPNGVLFLQFSYSLSIGYDLLFEILFINYNFIFQVTLGRCRMLEDEVKSLNAVLELRIGELQDLRRQHEIAQHDAQQLPAALQKNSVLQLKIEDLEAQLERKSTSEQYVPCLWCVCVCVHVWKLEMSQ